MWLFDSRDGGGGLVISFSALEAYPEIKRSLRPHARHLEFPVMKIVRIGAGAGYAGDRIEPAVELALHGSLDYLVFECLAERTIALAQEARAKDPSRGFDPMLERRLEAVLPACRERGVTIVTNMGAANPAGAGGCARDLARRLGCLGLTIATVSGDDVYDVVMAGDFTIAETGEPVSMLKDRLISANAYIGAEPIVGALSQGAQLVITGRAADPSLFVGPAARKSQISSGSDSRSRRCRNMVRSSSPR
jgi:hypothetical protein